MARLCLHFVPAEIKSHFTTIAIPESSIYCFNKIQFISRSPWQLHTFRVVGADDALLSGPLIVGVRNSGLLPLGVRKVNAGLSKKWGSMFSRMKSTDMILPATYHDTCLLANIFIRANKWELVSESILLSQKPNLLGPSLITSPQFNFTEAPLTLHWLT